ncbi:hypothetical protein NDU88_008970 [Pleurodeles waltl]|uniref:Uncharacterized protein n=1 Tax=Pleurodeles waltl TaxID=8319 RepID=A0AAV7PS01_PLEWA|nr:hypothetical protein NDU88_008970 [Pleurodeles waltl]
MDQRVIRALELLKEAGCLDLIAAPAAPRVRPVQRAASGVAATVAACSPPRGRQPVSGLGRGRSGGMALAHKGRVVGGEKTRPRPLRAGRPRGIGNCGAGGGVENPSDSLSRGQLGRHVESAGAREGGAQGSGHSAIKDCCRYGSRWGGRKGGDGSGAGSPSFSGGGDRERAHDRPERMGRKEDKKNAD